MKKIDVKDRKLLYYLSEDSSLTNTQLAKKTGLGKNAVSYRIDRLVKEKIIKNFVCTINIPLLKLETFDIFLKFNEDIYEGKEILNYFKEHPFTNWVITLSGNWDIFAEFIFKDTAQMEELIRGIIEHFGETLNSYQIICSFSTPIKIERLVQEFYKDLKLEPIPKKENIPKPQKLDNTDKKILGFYSQNSAEPFLSIAEKLKLSFDVVNYRLKNIIRKRIILKSFAQISLSELGYSKYLYKIRLKNCSKEHLEAIKREIKLNPNITYAFLDITSFTLIFVCALKSNDQMDRLSRKIRKAYPNQVDSQEYFLIKEEIVYNQFPKGLINLEKF